MPRRCSAPVLGFALIWADEPPLDQGNQLLGTNCLRSPCRDAKNEQDRRRDRSRHGLCSRDRRRPSTASRSDAKEDRALGDHPEQSENCIARQAGCVFCASRTICSRGAYTLYTIVSICAKDNDGNSALANAIAYCETSPPVALFSRLSASRHHRTLRSGRDHRLARFRARDPDSATAVPAQVTLTANGHAWSAARALLGGSGRDLTTR